MAYIYMAYIYMYIYMAMWPLYHPIFGKRYTLQDVFVPQVLCCELDEDCGGKKAPYRAIPCPMVSHHPPY